MADDERLTLRDLPPVDDPPRVPERLSQTLLSHANNCRRAAYLYMRWGGGTPAHQLDFGTAIHLFAERAMRELIERDEPSLYAPAEGEDPVAAQKQVASLTAAMVDEVLRDRPDLTVPIAHKSHSVDHLREQAYHWAVAQDVDPRTVLAIEQKFVLDLPSGVTVSGKVDLATDRGGNVFGVDDLKSTFAAETEGDFEEKFQGRLYALLLLFGTPVETVLEKCAHREVVTEGPCPGGCDGSGWIARERRMPKLGEHVQWVRVREVYPRLKPLDGVLRHVTAVYSRQELQDWIPDLDLLASDVMHRATESLKFPAVPGSHCSICPCQPECPLPPVVRRHAGTINTLEEAAEAAEWIEVVDPQVKATKKELKAVAKKLGPIRYGRDLVYEFTEQESRVVESWPRLEVAIAEAVQFGVAFDLAEHRKSRVSTRFGSRKLVPAELERGDDEEVLTDGQSRWGDASPF